MRTFVRVRALAATHGDLAKRLAELEEKTEALAMSHDTFSHNTRAQLKKVFDALRELMTPPIRPSGLSGSSAPRTRATRRPRGQEARRDPKATPWNSSEAYGNECDQPCGIEGSSKPKPPKQG